MSFGFSPEGYFSIRVSSDHSLSHNHYGGPVEYQCQIVRGERAHYMRGGTEPVLSLPYGINFTLYEMRALVAEMERQRNCEHCGLTQAEASACHPVIP